MKEKLPFILFFFSITLLACLLVFYTHFEKKAVTDSTNRQRLLSIQWAKSFPGVSSESLNMSCRFEGKPICCSAVDEDHYFDWVDENRLKSNVIPKKKSRHALHEEFAGSELESKCSDSRVYHPSPYEIKHIEFAGYLHSNFKSNTRESTQKLVEFITSPVAFREAKLWLERVKFHTKNGSSYSEDDEYILSKFVITRTCRSKKGNDSSNITYSWIEWIEPLSVHCRHPFAWSQCGSVPKMNGASTANLTDIDYLLLQNGESFHNHTSPNSALLKHMPQRQSLPIKHYLFDAGTSTFDSSLVFFVCMYAEVH